MQIAPTNSELMLRWMQFGVFSPIFRTHGASQEGNERRIWKFDNFPMLLDCVNLRYQLMPYVYTAARQAYDTGVSICRPLYYDWPEENEAYRQEGEYMFGDDILVSPIVTAADAVKRTFHKTWLPEGTWYDVCHNEMLKGASTISSYYGLADIPYSILVCNPVMMNLKKAPERLVVKVVPGEHGEFVLYEDAGDTQDYVNGAYANTMFSQSRNSEMVSLVISPRQGTYEGMLTERAYDVVFLLEDEPREVAINGVATENWTYDAMMKTVTVSVPSTACDQQVIVSLKRSLNDIRQIGDATIVSQQYFDLQGREYTYPPSGTYIIKSTGSNGRVAVKKVIR